MRRNMLAIYVHLVWATWDRQPFITPAIERDLHRTIEAICRDCGCDVLAIGGMPDHVHILVTLPTTISLADVVRRVKSGSSTYANRTLVEKDSFRWQGNYGAFTVCAGCRQKVVAYIENQKKRHAVNNIWATAEQTYEELPKFESDAIQAVSAQAETWP